MRNQKSLFFILSIVIAIMIIGKNSLDCNRKSKPQRAASHPSTASQPAEEIPPPQRASDETRSIGTDAKTAQIIKIALKQMYHYRSGDKKLTEDVDHISAVMGDSIRGWLSPAFVENQIKKYFLLTEIGFAGFPDCHACAPDIGAAIIAEKNGKPIIEYQKTIIETDHVMGSWGHLSHWQFIRIGPNKMAVLFDHWGGNQGYFGGSYEILTHIGHNKFMMVADLPGGEDNTGAGGKEHHRTNLKVLNKVANGYYIIKLVYFPLDAVQKKYLTEFYRFNGKNFICYQKKYLSVPTKQIRALQKKHRQSLM